MPMYEYECDDGHTFEVEQSIKDEPFTTCVLCGATVKRLISNTSFILKGSGWTPRGSV